MPSRRSTVEAVAAAGAAADNAIAVSARPCQGRVSRLYPGLPASARLFPRAARARDREARQPRQSRAPEERRETRSSLAHSVVRQPFAARGVIAVLAASAGAWGPRTRRITLPPLLGFGARRSGPIGHAFGHNRVQRSPYDAREAQRAFRALSDGVCRGEQGRGGPSRCPEPTTRLNGASPRRGTSARAASRSGARVVRARPSGTLWSLAGG